jgi:hypothetical protein
MTQAGLVSSQTYPHCLCLWMKVYTLTNLAPAVTIRSAFHLHYIYTIMPITLIFELECPVFIFSALIYPLHFHMQLGLLLVLKMQCALQYGIVIQLSLAFACCMSSILSPTPPFPCIFEPLVKRPFLASEKSKKNLNMLILGLACLLLVKHE